MKTRDDLIVLAEKNLKKAQRAYSKACGKLVPRQADFDKMKQAGNHQHNVELFVKVLKASKPINTLSLRLAGISPCEREQWEHLTVNEGGF